MRDNGLRAESYVAVADLDPRIADALLTILGDAGIAAYTEPCQPAVGAVPEARLPSLPCVRLYVDQAAEQQARSVMDDHLTRLRSTVDQSDRHPHTSPEGSDSTSGQRESGDDRGEPDTHEPDGPAQESDAQAWEQIVAGFNTPATDVVPRWPAAEDLTEDSTQDGMHVTADAQDRDDAGANPTDASDEDRFVPPPPPPLPKLEPLTKLAWAAFLGGPLILLVSAVAGIYLPRWLVFAGVVGFIGGFVTLVVRMKGGPPNEGDDGAVV
ncbi:MAG TPA: hypothetical protein VIL34_20000 [Actinopolymorphaceae bacterium]